MDSPFAARVDRWHPRHRKQQDVERIEVGWILEPAGDPIHVVIVGKRVQRQPAIDSLGSELTVDSVGDLEIVPVIVAGPKRLIAFVVGGGGEPIRRCPPSVVVMHDLTEQPEIGSPYGLRPAKSRWYQAQ